MFIITYKSSNAGKGKGSRRNQVTLLRTAKGPCMIHDCVIFFLLQVSLRQEGLGKGMLGIYTLRYNHCDEHVLHFHLYFSLLREAWGTRILEKIHKECFKNINGRGR